MATIENDEDSIEYASKEMQEFFAKN